MKSYVLETIYQEMPYSLLLNLGLPLDYQSLTYDHKELFRYLVNVKEPDVADTITELEAEKEDLERDLEDLERDLEDRERDLEDRERDLEDLERDLKRTSEVLSETTVELKKLRNNLWSMVEDHIKTMENNLEI